MDASAAVKALAALAQESRLAIFRTLVQVGPAGLPAGQLAGPAPGGWGRAVGRLFGLGSG